MSSLGRMCLRLAAVSALRGATIAGDNVFDSRVEAVNLTDSIPIAGAIAVYSEQDDGEALSSQNGGPPFNPTIELVFEISIQARVVQPDGSYVVGAPVTDDELESTLDIIEAQVELTLFRSYSPLSVLFRRVAKRVKQKTSVRFVDPKGGEKLAVRYALYQVEIDDRETPVYDPALSGLDRLPEPFRSIAIAWPDNLPEKEKALAAAQLLVGRAPPPLSTIFSNITVGKNNPFSEAFTAAFGVSPATAWPASLSQIWMI